MLLRVVVCRFAEANQVYPRRSLNPSFRPPLGFFWKHRVAGDGALNQGDQAIDVGWGERIDEPQDEIRVEALRWIGHVDDLDVDIQYIWSWLGDAEHVLEDGRGEGEEEFVNPKFVIVGRTLGSEDDIFICQYVELFVHGCSPGTESSERLVLSLSPAGRLCLGCRRSSRLDTRRCLQGKLLPLCPWEISS